ncbi:PadR family transcriptional regulator [Pseudoclavibacter caeni]|jgi:DNA-binding PadR family transcriptional regulator|uniref:PadR family transcriptional regulator n=1 Tax=Pseudoclavibacter caeni TaxID=908846 RepID=A0A7C8BNJ2_9MICO|nr:PadR family transcriptional regulator [Pseudoclavibacter caeni]KAB1632780.1 PadR family transcriptional regulator [Pseudoclavibacter caeni]NYJ97269.1 DNA-binding PadR family transcriptional regulator [Pseudoclavibacter caeni]
MVVRYGILGILAESPCYGTQLRQELLRRTAGLLDVNSGQIYSTLDRLARDGLVHKLDTPEHGRVLYEPTEQGLAVFRHWLETVDEGAATIDTIRKVSLALSLPSVDGQAVAQRNLDACLQRSTAPMDGLPEPLTSMVWLGYHSVLNAETNWLRQVIQQASRTPTAFPVDQERPRRGRPPKRVSRQTVPDAGEAR